MTMNSYNITISLSDVTWRERLWDVEVEGEYTPGRAAPACSNPDSAAYSDQGDPSEFEPCHLRWEATEGAEIGQGGPDGPDGTDLLQHGTVQVWRGVPPTWTTQWVTMPLFMALDAAADEQGPDQVPERE